MLTQSVQQQLTQILSWEEEKCARKKHLQVLLSNDLVTLSQATETKLYQIVDVNG